MAKVINSTTATNRKLRELLVDIDSNKLVPQPEFQRRLVWTNKDKLNFIKTVLEGYPFPEIYIAAGEINEETGASTELLVDGQQRITTLHEYFKGSVNIKMDKNMSLYKDLSVLDKRAFLDYDVVIRYLGNVNKDQVVEVFSRINSTKYSLNAMELNNARYDGAFKKFGEKIAEYKFFEEHQIFSASKVRRMDDLKYVLVLISTMLSNYFSGFSELEDFLDKYNDDFPQAQTVEENLLKILSIIDMLGFTEKSRVWNEGDLFTLIIEIHRKMLQQKGSIDIDEIRQSLHTFYQEVDMILKNVESDYIFGTTELREYSQAMLQGTNSRNSRMRRGKIVASVLAHK